MLDCKSNVETIFHIISECPKLLEKENKRQFDWIRKTVHLDIGRRKGVNLPEKWYEHKPLPCRENES